jgi:hypothetical protein
MILNQFINYFPYASAQQGSIAYKGQKLLLRDVLMNQHEQYEQLILQLRNIKENELKVNFKKSKLPCYFVSCFCESNGLVMAAVVSTAIIPVANPSPSVTTSRILSFNRCAIKTPIVEPIKTAMTLINVPDPMNMQLAFQETFRSLGFNELR